MRPMYPEASILCQITQAKIDFKASNQGLEFENFDRKKFRPAMRTEVLKIPMNSIFIRSTVICLKTFTGKTMGSDFQIGTSVTVCASGYSAISSAYDVASFKRIAAP